jgi:hypothetical protein
VKPAKPPEAKPLSVPADITVVTAKHSFTGRTDKELSFKKKDKLRIIKSVNNSFFKAELDSKVGYVPKSYVTTPVVEKEVVDMEVEPADTVDISTTPGRKMNRKRRRENRTEMVILLRYELYELT